MFSDLTDLNNFVSIAIFISPQNKVDWHSNLNSHQLGHLTRAFSAVLKQAYVAGGFLGFKHTRVSGEAAKSRDGARDESTVFLP